MRVGPGAVSRHAYLFIYFKFLLFGDFLLERQECVLGAAAVWVNGGGGSGGTGLWFSPGMGAGERHRAHRAALLLPMAKPPVCCPRSQGLPPNTQHRWFRVDGSNRIPLGLCVPAVANPTSYSSKTWFNVSCI